MSILLAHPDYPHLGLSQKEINKFSISRWIKGVIENKPEYCAFERECSDLALKLRNTKADFQQDSNFRHELFIPNDVLHKRDLTVGSNTAGGFLVGTKTLTMADMIRNKMVLGRLGATYMDGLKDNISIPRQTGSSTVSWVAENADPGSSDQTLGSISMSPKTIGGRTNLSRKFFKQNNADRETFIINDLMATIATAIDQVAINGGGTNEPIGILQTPGIGDVAGGTNGLAPTRAHMVELEGDVADQNADIGSLGYLTTSKARTKLRKTENATGTGLYVWEDGIGYGEGRVLGHRAEVSNAVPSNLTKGSGTDLSAIIFGSFADLIVASWGAVQIIVDVHTSITSGTIKVTVLREIDIALRNPESFSAMQDAITS